MKEEIIKFLIGWLAGIIASAVGVLLAFMLAFPVMLSNNFQTLKSISPWFLLYVFIIPFIVHVYRTFKGKLNG